MANFGVFWDKFGTLLDKLGNVMDNLCNTKATKNLVFVPKNKETHIFTVNKHFSHRSYYAMMPVCNSEMLNQRTICFE